MFRILLAALFCAFSGSLPAADKNPSAYALAVATDRADCIYRRGDYDARVRDEVIAYLQGREEK